MNEHPRIRLLLYLADWTAVISVIVLIVIFSLTGGMLPSPTLMKSNLDSAVPAKDVRPILLAVFLAAMAVDGVMLVYARFPGMFRYPVKINAQNVEVQYYLGKIMLDIAISATNMYMCVVMILFYLQRIDTDSTTILSLTAILCAFYAFDWLMYYAAARFYK